MPMPSSVTSSRKVAASASIRATRIVPVRCSGNACLKALVTRPLTISPQGIACATGSAMLLELLHGELAFGNVGNGTEHEPALLKGDRRQADLHRNLHAVLAQAIEIPAHTHGAGLWRFQKIMAELHVFLTHARRQQLFQGRTDQLAVVVTEQTFDAGVGEGDAAFDIDYQPADRRRFEDGAEVLCGLLRVRHALQLQAAGGSAVPGSVK